MDTIDSKDDFFSFDDYEEDILNPRVRPNTMPEEYKQKLQKKPKPRSHEEWQTFFPRYPSTPDGYMKSFFPTEVKEYKETLSKYGFVVIKNVLTPEQCDLTVEEFFMDVNRRSQKFQKSKILIDDPMTWETWNFPSQKRKFLVCTPALTRCAFENRTNPVLYDIYCNLLGRKDIWCNIDNWGFFRGTKNLKWKNPDGTEYITDRDDWRYNLLLHWDCNPWVLKKWQDQGEPELFQGLVALDDCPEEVGGFMAVPGSHEYLPIWISERPCPRMSRASLRPSPDDPMQSYVQKVPLRKGEMVIWYTRTAHCNFPNYSHRMRFHQYIRCLPATRQSQDKDTLAPLRVIRKYRDDEFTDWSLPFLTPLGRKMVGLDMWEGEVRREEEVFEGEEEIKDLDEEMQ